jgi:hypothetical protein
MPYANVVLIQRLLLAKQQYEVLRLELLDHIQGNDMVL